jgi:hypothetical protein
VNRACQLIALGMALTCIALLIAAVTVAPVHGHDHARPDLDGWYMGLRSGLGPCCGGPKVDATVLEDADWQSLGDHFSVRIDGQWIAVDDAAVLKEPNRAGRTMVWLGFRDGKPFVRCFLPGAMI